MKTIGTFACLLAMISIFSCHKVNLCGLERDITSGSIEQLLTLDCFVGGANQQIIRTTEELQSLFADRPCEGEIPDIDFTQYTLLGQYGSATGCQRFYNRNVRIRESEKTYIFSVKVSECGGCEPLELRWHWVLVPVLPEDYTVTFEFETL